MRCNPEVFAVSRFSRDKNLIQFDPVYQREGGVWSKAKKQLFVDSLLNGFDIPKIYMHRLSRDETGHDYAVIDGKQRITTIFSFLNGEFDLAEDFLYTGRAISEPPKAGDRYADLSEAARDILKEVQLNVVVVETADVEEIEELFSRLNNGEKLNAAESRNALGGNMAGLVRDAAKLEFFGKKLKFPNTRYAHLEVACKLLYLEMQSSKSPASLVVVDLKKKFLDDFVRQYRDISAPERKKLLDRLSGNLKAISPVFDDGDIELSKQSYPQLMYLFCNDILRQYGAPDIKGRLKDFLRDFRLERQANLLKDEDSRDAELSEYGRLMQQGTNDTGSMKARIDILTKRFLRANPSVELKDTKRAFTLEERWVLWHRSGKRCEKCKSELATLEELDGDHIVWHINGGPTSLENAQALCVACNRGHGGKAS
ncbi:DUF262 domain-containing protein [Knoellia sp. S7-12]|uniref:GmrSD restriction endonuclease domain-containing protein n=1 Tax=Knoellia sp. S7-12 TaxID=3126698 RepID=UPI00336767CF